jgi:Mlc titration factor MtfA (ptsG expression regulator)
VGAANLQAALPLLALAALVVPAVGALLVQPRWTEHRRRRLRTRPFPAEWARIVRHRVPLVARLPPDLRHRLEGQIQVFIAEKPFIGCQGQVIDDELRVTIAAQACLLLLGQPDAACFPRLRQVLVYPDPFVVKRTHMLPGGVVDVQPQSLAGESWSQGQVILAWSQVLEGAADSSDGRNVVLHEFAHQIDQDSGAADGRPWQRSAAARHRWAVVMDAALARLRETPSTVLDAYGGSDAAEYFAVATEAFFERPLALADEAPDVYAELARLYGVQPATWATDQPSPGDWVAA